MLLLLIAGFALCNMTGPLVAEGSRQFNGG